MIILQNQLFSCEPCIWAKKGQSCTHAKECLLSLRDFPHHNHSTSKDMGSNKSHYRLEIPKSKAKVSTIYNTSAHRNEDILFSRELGVDIGKSVGAHIFVLSDSTKTDTVTPLKDKGDPLIEKSNLLVKVPFGKPEYDATDNPRIRFHSDSTEPIIFRHIEHSRRPVFGGGIDETSKVPVTIHPVYGIEDPTRLPGPLPPVSPNGSVYGRYPSSVCEDFNDLVTLEFTSLLGDTEGLLKEMKARLAEKAKTM